MSDLKTLYLIRHAESMENERLASLTRSLSTVSRFSLPSKSDLYRSVQLLNVPAQVDSEVSSIGWDQINQVGECLRADDFLSKKDVQLVAHSPLLRARQTSEGMLGCVTAPSSSSSSTSSSESTDTLSPPVKRVEELTCLLEKTPSEWIPGNFGGFADRMTEFKDWVCDQPENNIAIVGHSQFFKAMLELDYKFDNCDVWEVALDCAVVAGRNESSSAGEDNVDEGEEKKDDSGVKDCSAGAEDSADVPLPRGWRGLKQLYKYERKEQV
mmetsp:Transcript_2904/g.6293  ORF Transcript_2904/g.6293 Transcript_2904/m.6293 type:complete len:269 (+) Transcript_2904:85-891(+)